MPNWCFTSYVVVGEENQIKDLYQKMQELENMDKSLVDNGFGKTYLGNLVVRLGGNWKDIYCRGKWDYLTLIDENSLAFEVICAWSELNEFRHFIEKQYPGMKIYHISREPSESLYYTNDKEERFFRRIWCVTIGEDGLQEFYSEKEAVQYISKKIQVPDLQDFKNAVDSLDEWSEEHKDVWVEAYRYEYIND